MRKFLLLVLFIVLFVIPVSAADMNDDNFVNVLEFTSFDTDGDNIISIKSGDNNFSVSLPQTSYTRYIDMLFLTSRVSDFSISAGTASDLNTLTVEQISSNLYRAYGQVYYGRYSEVNFLINSVSAGYIEVLQFRYASQNTNTYEIEAYCSINAADYQSTIHYVPTDTINYRSWTNSSTLENSFYQLYVWVEDWRKYDYIDIQLFLDVASIQTISGMMGPDNIDLDISFISSNQWDSNMFYVSIGIDCTQFTRTTDDDPQIIIFGNAKYDMPNSVNFVNCSGKVFRSVIDSNNYWFSTLVDTIKSSFASLNSKIDTKFSNLSTWIQNQTTAIVNAINGDTSSGEEFQEELATRDEELENMSQIMDSIPKPDFDDITLDIQVDNAALTPLTFQLNTLLTQSIFSSLFLMAFILAIAAYILYGKR